MARHGYLGDDYGSEYDPNYDADDDDRRGERGWRSGSERSGWHRDERGGGGRNFMFDERDDRRTGRGNEGGSFFSRLGEQATSWFSDDDDRDNRHNRSRGSDESEWFGGRSSGMSRGGGMSHYGREHGSGGFQGDFGGGRQQGGFGGRGDWNRQQGGRQSFSNHPDDHYRSWRDKQMEALDRDYQDYCREREQQFHQEFDSWRQNRQGQSRQSGEPMGQSNQGAATQSGSTGSSAEGGDELLLSRKASSMTDAPNEPMSATVSGDGGATMGTTPETTRRNR